jgi:hypothetical protein
MKITRILIVLSLFGMALDSFGQAVADDTLSVATQALPTLRKLANEKSYKTMGFASLQEVEATTLNEPISTSMVRLDDLRAYKHGDDSEKIVKPLEKVVYPVTANGEVRSSITLAKVKNSWKATGFGGANFIRLITKARTNCSNADHLPLTSYFAVQVPALNTWFIAHRSDNKLMLAPVLSDPALNLVEGQTSPADEVFEKLAPKAKAYNGLPL